MKTVTVTLLKDFVKPGRTIPSGTTLEITEDRVQNFIDTGLIAGKTEKKKVAKKIEKATIDKSI